MFFGNTDDQLQLERVVDDVLRGSCPPEAVRDAWTAAPGQLDRTAWMALRDLGLPEALVPVVDGGLGLDERDLTLVFEQVGRHAVPLPLVETVLVAPALLGGQVDGRLFATNLGGDLVSCAADADSVLIRRASGEIRAHQPGELELRPVASVDGARRLSEIGTVSGGAFVTADAAVTERAIRRGVFGASAVLIGLAQRMLEMTVEYVCERRQFGVAIGSFQAIKHHCSDALQAITFARPAVHRAAWSLATNAATQERDVAMAKAMAGSAAVKVGRLALQCHGAIGYTIEYDLQLFLKRAESWEVAWGQSATHRQTVAQALRLAT